MCVCVEYIIYMCIIDILYYNYLYIYILCINMYIYIYIWGENDHLENYGQFTVNKNGKNRK